MLHAIIAAVFAFAIGAYIATDAQRNNVTFTSFTRDVGFAHPITTTRAQLALAFLQHGSNSAAYVEALTGVAVAYWKAHEPRAALPYLEEAATLYETMYG